MHNQMINCWIKRAEELTGPVLMSRHNKDWAFSYQKYKIFMPVPNIIVQ